MSKDLINKNLDYNIDIVVISCDNYSDVWPYFFNNFFKNWQDCPLEIYLISNKKTFNHEKVNNINIGEDTSWSANLKKGIKSLKKKYVMLFIDDLIINKTISHNYFTKISNWLKFNSPNYLRLHISFKPDYYDGLIGALPKISPYKVSLMPSIWNRNFLSKMLNSEESAWDFEIKGSKRAYKYDKFFSTQHQFISYDNSIIKGKWQRHIARKLKINKNLRPVMSLGEQYVYNLKVLRSALFNSLPNSLKIKIKKI